MISLAVATQLIGLIFEIIGTFFFAENVLHSDEKIKELSFRQVGGFDENIQKQLKDERTTARRGLAILLIGLFLQGIGLLF